MKFEEMLMALKPVINSMPVPNVSDEICRIQEYHKKIREEEDRRILEILNESFGMNLQDMSCVSLTMFADMWEQELQNNQPSIEDEIRSIKKQLKHCKNPMQIKQLNQRLNILYKEKKKFIKPNRNAV